MAKRVVLSPVEFCRDIFGGLRITVRSGNETRVLYIPRELLLEFYRESDFWRKDAENMKALELFPDDMPSGLARVGS